MVIIPVLFAIVSLARGGSIGNECLNQSATSQSSSLPTRTTPLRIPPGSRALTSVPAMIKSSRTSRVATSPRLTTPSPSPPPSLASPTSPTESNSTEVRLNAYRKRLPRPRILLNQENWTYGSYFFSFDSDLWSDKPLEAYGGLFGS